MPGIKGLALVLGDGQTLGGARPGRGGAASPAGQGVARGQGTRVWQWGGKRCAGEGANVHVCECVSLCARVSMSVCVCVCTCAPVSVSMRGRVSVHA